MKKTCVMLAIVAFLCTACESNKTNVMEEKEPEKIEEQQPEQPVQEEPIQEEIIEEEVVEELTEQEKARVELVDKYGLDVVVAWEKLSRDEFFNYIGYELVVKEHYGLRGEKSLYCYKILEDGTFEEAHVGGEYYVYGVFVSNEAIVDLVAYHNEFFS